MKLTDIQPLDIDNSINKVKNRVNLASVELEGGWKTLPAGVTHVERDGSVFRDRPPVGVKYYGELPVGPTVPGGLRRLIWDNYPDVVDQTCGMHVHMSFTIPLHYGILMVPEYTVTVVEYLKRWGKANNIGANHCFWSRLRGESPYCKLEFTAEAQVKHTRKSHDMNMAGNRYTVIHYCGRLETIECRVLPMFGSRALALSATREVINITNACIYELSKKYKQHKAGEIVQLPNNLTYEETIVDIV